jgi:phage terminase large subunit
LGFKNVIDVNFGAHSPDPQCRFMRDHMWQAMKQWLITGAIDKDPQLEADLTGPGLRPENQQRIWLEAKADMKARGLDSPDDADALALTFAQPVKARVRKLTDDVTVMPTRGEMAWGMQ